MSPSRVDLLRAAVAAEGGEWTTQRVLALFRDLKVPMDRAACQSRLRQLTSEGVLGRIERRGLRSYTPITPGGAS